MGIFYIFAPKVLIIMVKYITDDGVLMDYCDFVQFLEFKMKFDLWSNVECWKLFLNSFDEYAIDLDRWNTLKQSLVETISII